MEKCVGLGSDGASVMVGCKNGVNIIMLQFSSLYNILCNITLIKFNSTECPQSLYLTHIESDLFYSGCSSSEECVSSSEVSSLCRPQTGIGCISSST